MTRFAYTAEDASGDLVRGQVDAASREDARETLAKDQLTPLKLEPTGWTAIRLSGPTARMPSKTLADFSYRLAGLLEAGLPLADGLALIGSQDGCTAPIARAVLLRIRSGQALSDALAELTPAPDPQTLALISVGEETGRLGTQLRMISDDLTRKRALQRELMGQMIYPIALLILIALTMVFLAFLVLPQFEGIFDDTGHPPPRETAFVMAAGRLIRKWGWLLPAFLLAGLLIGRWLRQRFRDAFDGFFLSVPVIGSLIIMGETSQFCRSLGALVSGGCDLSRGMSIATETISLPIFKARYSAVSERVRGGQPLASALDREGLMVRDAIQLIDMGERTGRLGAMLLEAASSCETHRAHRLKRIAALTGPALTALMGLITAGVIAAVMTGVLSLNDAVAG